MTKEQRPTFDVDLPAGAAKFLAIYRPMKPLFEGMQEKYALTFPAECVDDAELLLGVRIKSPKGGLFEVPTVSCSSPRRPEVEPYDDLGTDKTVLLDRLVLELQRLDARNVPREWVFDGRRLRLTIRPFDYVVSGHKGTALSLEKVMVCMTEDEPTAQYWREEP